MASPISKGKPSAGSMVAPSKSDRPFYAAPEDKPTPVQIINETRTWLRTVQTKRPFTPRDDSRSLFGGATNRNPESRPPSAFSLGARHFDESRPPSGARLTPLDHQRPRASESEAVLPPKPPAPSQERHSSGGSSRRKASTGLPVGSAVAAAAARPVHQQDFPQVKRSGSLNNLLASGEDPLHTEPPKSPLTVHRNSITSYISVETKLPTSPTRKQFDLGKPDSGYMSEHRCQSGGSSRGSSAGVNVSGVVPGPKGDRTPSRTTSGSSSRGNSGGGRRTLSEETGDTEGAESSYYATHLAPIVDLLGAEGSELSDLVALTDLLYQEMDRGGLLGKSSSRRSHILKTVFRLLDRSDCRLHVSLARLILALKVSGNNLTNVCKLAFKVAKEKVNDQLFLDYKMPKLLVKTLDHLDVQQSQEALVYLTCTFKFLSSNPTLAEQLARHRCIEALDRIQTAIAEANQAGRTNDQYAHILVQVAGALRNLSGVEGTRGALLASSCLESLVTVLEQYPSDYDLALNAARFLSKTSQHADCCQRLGAIPNFCALARTIMIKFYAREDLVVRISFVLGNLTARSDECRMALFPDKASLDSVLKVFNHWLKVSGQANSPGPSSNGGSEDVLVKLVRLLANGAISEHVGRIAANSKTCLGFLLNIIGSRSATESEELVLNSISAVNNLTYYMDATSDLASRQLKVAEALVCVVLQDHMEALKGAVGVFGNLSRERHIRDFVVHRQLDLVLITLLDSGHQETVYCSVGVLLNLMADVDKRTLLRKENGVRRLVDVLHDFASQDWQLAGLVCKTLWNYTENIQSSETALGETLAQELIDLLIEYTDSEVANSFIWRSDVSPETSTFLQEMWESEFLPVASDLLRRLECHQSQFEPL